MLSAVAVALIGGVLANHARATDHRIATAEQRLEAAERRERECQRRLERLEERLG